MADVSIGNNQGWVVIGAGDRAVTSEPSLTGTTVALQGAGASAVGLTFDTAAPNPGYGETCIRVYAYDAISVLDCHSTAAVANPGSLDRVGFIYSDGATNLRIYDCSTGPLGESIPYDHSCYLNGVAQSGTWYIEGCDFRDNAGAPVHAYSQNSSGTIRNSFMGGDAWGGVAWGSGTSITAEYCDIFDQGSRQEGGYTSRAGLHGASGGVCYYRNCTFYDNYADLLGNTSALTAGPAKVTGLTVTPGAGANHLSWTNPTLGTFDSIIVRRHAGQGAISESTDVNGFPRWSTSGTLVYSGTASSFTDTGLSDGTTYYYSVITEDAGQVSPRVTGTGTPASSGGVQQFIAAAVAASSSVDATASVIKRATANVQGISDAQVQAMLTHAAELHVIAQSGVDIKAHLLKTYAGRPFDPDGWVPLWGPRSSRYHYRDR